MVTTAALLRWTFRDTRDAPRRPQKRNDAQQKGLREARGNLAECDAISGHSAKWTGIVVDAQKASSDSRKRKTHVCQSLP